MNQHKIVGKQVIGLILLNFSYTIQFGDENYCYYICLYAFTVLLSLTHWIYHRGKL